MNYSLTQAGNLVKMVAAVLVLVGFTITPEQQEALVVVLGLVGEVVGFVMSWVGRMRAGDVDLLGFKKDV